MLSNKNDPSSLIMILNESDESFASGCLREMVSFAGTNLHNCDIKQKIN